MSSRSAWNAISCASRVSSDRRPSSSSATAAAQPVALAHQPLRGPRARSRSRGLLQQVHAGAGAPAASASPSRARIARHSAAACATTGSTSAPGHLGAAPSPAVDEHVRLPGDELERHVAGEAERRLHLPEARRDQPGPIEVHARTRRRARGTRPSAPAPPRAPGRTPAAAAHASRPRARSDPPGSLAREIEIAVVDGPDLDPEPASGHGALRCAEPRHAVGQRASVMPGKPSNLRVIRDGW